MANLQHIKWLHEGVESWNARRNQSLFTPDFSGADLFREFKNTGTLDAEGRIPLAHFDFNHANLTKAHIFHADLRNSCLVATNFEDANLVGARFDRASLEGASLRNANLAAASFIRADLDHADLSSADLRSATLERARLSFANLTDADLAETNLTETNLCCACPWVATLFLKDMATPIETSERFGGEISGIDDLIRACSESLPGNGFSDGFYFRGESANSWELRPCVMRPGTDGDFKLRTHEGKMLLELISRRPADFRDAPFALDQWVRAQHHGLKTRLLDITRNPLVALLSACGALDADPETSAERVGRIHFFSVPRHLIKPYNSDTIAILANFAKLPRPEQDTLLGRQIADVHERSPDFMDELSHETSMDRLYHLVRQERPHFNERIDPRDFFGVFVVEPTQSFQRIRVQAGAFLISGFHERFERSQILKWNQTIPVYEHSTFDVPVHAKKKILHELRLLNVTRETLVPELDEVAKSITGRFS